MSFESDCMPDALFAQYGGIVQCGKDTDAKNDTPQMTKRLKFLRVPLGRRLTRHDNGARTHSLEVRLSRSV